MTVATVAEAEAVVQGSSSSGSSDSCSNCCGSGCSGSISGSSSRNSGSGSRGNRSKGSISGSRGSSNRHNTFIVDTPSIASLSAVGDSADRCGHRCCASSVPVRPDSFR